MKARWLRWLDSTWGRFTFVMFVVWITFMAVGLIQFLTGGGAWGFLIATLLVAWVYAMLFLIPRVSNWVQYRKWDARLDHYKDPATDGGSTEGEK